MRSFTFQCIFMRMLIILFVGVCFVGSDKISKWKMRCKITRIQYAFWIAGKLWSITLLILFRSVSMQPPSTPHVFNIIHFPLISFLGSDLEFSDRSQNFPFSFIFESMDSDGNWKRSLWSNQFYMNSCSHASGKKACIKPLPLWYIQYIKGWVSIEAYYKKWSLNNYELKDI